MRITIKILISLAFASSLSGCAVDYMSKDFAIPIEKYSPPPFELVSLGMDKQQVIDALGKPDQIAGARMVGSSNTETLEYFRYEEKPGPDYIAERYQVTFTNGKLSSYESSGDGKQQVNHRF